MTLKSRRVRFRSRIHGSAEDDCSGQALSSGTTEGAVAPFQRNTNDAEDATKKAADIERSTARLLPGAVRLHSTLSV